MRKNRVMFFGAAILGTVAVFLFSTVSPATPQARAYAIGSTAPEMPAPASVATTSSAGGSGSGFSLGAGSYDIGGSFQNLISPFTAFMSSLKWNTDTTVNANGVSFSWPTVNITPVLQNTFQNALGQWFDQFNEWFYHVSGVQLSGILSVLLNLFSWVLGLAQQVVNWLLGVFH